MGNDAFPFSRNIFSAFLKIFLSGDKLYKCIDGDCIWITDAARLIKYNPKRYGKLPINPDIMTDNSLTATLSQMSTSGYVPAKEECYYRRDGKFIVKLVGGNVEVYINTELIKWFNPLCAYEIKSPVMPVKVMYQGELVGAIMPMRFAPEVK